MGLFNKEACTFCGTEVGMLKRTKLKTKEFICNDCKRKTNYYARMDYTTRDAAQAMMDNLAAEEAAFVKSYEGAENRFQAAESSWHTWHIGTETIHYRRNSRNGGFQLQTGGISRYEAIPVFWFDNLLPYQFNSGSVSDVDYRLAERRDADANPVTLEISKNSEGKPESCTIKIPYDEETIREIRLQISVSRDDDLEKAKDFVDEINEDRRSFVKNREYTLEQKEKMQLRNLGDTAAAALKAAIKGEDVAETVKQGIEMANDIEDGKVRRGLFGKLKRK